MNQDFTDSANLTQNTGSQNASTSPSHGQLSALEAMRQQARSDPSAAYRAFDTYPWAIDPKFQELLARGLFQETAAAPQEAALQCRIQHYKDRVGIYIDISQYREYRAGGEFPKVNLVPPVLLEQERLLVPNKEDRKYAAIAEDWGDEESSSGKPPNGDEASQAAAPLWQRSAPKADLFIDKSAVLGEDGKEPYPKKFEELIAFLQTGKEIPGITKIPDTVIDDRSISTTSGRQAPLKPWEKRAINASTQHE